jgi:hypothetical protein
MRCEYRPSISLDAFVIDHLNSSFEANDTHIAAHAVATVSGGSLEEKEQRATYEETCGQEHGHKKQEVIRAALNSIATLTFEVPGICSG